MESKEKVNRETFEIADQLSMLGALKLRWIARHLQGLDEKGKRRLLCAGREMLEEEREGR